MLIDLLFDEFNRNAVTAPVVAISTFIRVLLESLNSYLLYILCH